jgi:hypothetical protein
MSQPQYSPDGRWWWDGRQWLRASPDRPPAPVARAVGRLEAPRAGAGPRLPLLLPVVLGLLGAVLVLVWVIAWAVPQPAGVSSAPMISPPVSAGQESPPPAQKYPYRYLPEVTVADIVQQLTSQGLTCDAPETIGQLGLSVWRCERQAGGLDYGVTIEGHSDREVHLVDASVVGLNQKPGLDAARPLFDVLAGLPFQRQPDLAAQARSWVRANAGRSGSVAIGQATYGTQPGDNEYFMEVDAGFVR